MADSADEFYRSPLVQRDLARHNASCSPVAATLQSLSSSYDTLHRVLVLDATANTNGVQGIGNLFGDYVFWFGLATAVQRALFVRWSADGRRFDLGTHFSGERNADWSWSRRSRRRLDGLAGGSRTSSSLRLHPRNITS